MTFLRSTRAFEHVRMSVLYLGATYEATEQANLAMQKNGQISPRLASELSASSDSFRASREGRAPAQPSARMREILSLTTGTSPFQPRSPPLYSYLTRAGSRPTTSQARSAISLTVIVSPVATLNTLKLS